MGFKKIEVIREFIEIYNGLFGESKKVTEANIMKYIKLHKTRELLPEMKPLINRWYRSLPDKPNYKVYSHESYMIEAVGCFFLYTRGYLLSIKRSIVFESFKNVKSVLDLGNGIGYSSKMLKEYFPEAKVYGTNVIGSQQYQFAQKTNKKDFTMTGKLVKADLIFASEYFEHIERPIEHLDDIIQKCNPKFLIIANSFNTKSTGHFLTYRHFDEEIKQELISRRFNSNLRKRGYRSMKTGIFNNKPRVWVKGNLIGDKFTFLSNGKKRNAIFISRDGDKIKAVLCDDRATEGVNVEIHPSQIIAENQIQLL